MFSRDDVFSDGVIFLSTTFLNCYFQSNLDLVGPEDLPQYGKFFQKKLEERLSQVKSDCDTVLNHSI